MPEVDIFWGGESSLFEKVAEQMLLQKVEIASRTTDNDSIMPANLPDLVGDGNLAHVAAFLMSGQ